MARGGSARATNPYVYTRWASCCIQTRLFSSRHVHVLPHVRDTPAELSSRQPSSPSVEVADADPSRVYQRAADYLFKLENTSARLTKQPCHPRRPANLSHASILSRAILRTSEPSSRSTVSLPPLTDLSMYSGRVASAIDDLTRERILRANLHRRYFARFIRCEYHVVLFHHTSFRRKNTHSIYLPRTKIARDFSATTPYHCCLPARPDTRAKTYRRGPFVRSPREGRKRKKRENAREGKRNRRGRIRDHASESRGEDGSLTLNNFLSLR